MTELLTAAQMRAMEQAAIDSGEVTGLELMERAGRGVVAAVFQEWPELATAPHRALVLCGPGNNGGDGFVVARRLRDRGWTVEVLLFGDPEKLPPDARRNYEVWCAMGDVAPLGVEAAAEGPRPSLLVDAMFGTGLSRAIPLECANAFHVVEDREVGGEHPWLVPYHTVAVDCPSGLDCDSGNFLLPDHPGDPDDVETHWRWWKDDASRRVLHPDLTVTFHRRKLGHYLSSPLLGALRVVDIGLGKEDRHPAHLKMPRDKDVVCLLDFETPKGRSGRIWPGRDLDKGASRRSAHKYTHGHALILSGPPGKTGAARLAARGALRIGAGLVTLGVPPAAQLEAACHLTAIMLTRVPDAEALAAALEDDRLGALCIGPGFGTGEREAAILATALEVRRASPGPRGGRDRPPRGGGSGDARRAAGRDAGDARIASRPTILDADALTLLSQHPDLFAALHDACVLTPHAGEFRRLFPDLAEKLDAPATTGPAYSKVDATREAAARAGCVVLFKGPDTVIADPSGRCAINASLYDRAAPWLATAGAGDVLAGFIAGLLAREFEPLAAAETAAWLHTECALSFGPGLIAEDLPETLPQVFRDLGL